jgi:hypothetical protein
MDADSNGAAAGRERQSSSIGGGDKLSRLGDGTLGHILSFLPATEAARAASLSRRWRHVFPAVHSLSFREAEKPLSTGHRYFQRCSYCGPDDGRAPRLVTGVGSALHGRDRGPRAAAAPLRAFRVAFDEYGFRTDDATMAVDGWLSYAAYHAADALEIDLRLVCEPVCLRNYTLLPPGVDAVVGDGDGGGGEGDQPMDTDPPSPPPPTRSVRMYEYGDYYTRYATPKSLFSSAALRSLRLSHCWLDLPSAFALPSLDTLHLTNPTGESGAVQRLVSACPRLADLTLEACGGGLLTELSVLDARLRRLALRCCHELAAVAVDTSELRAFEYRGAVPQPRFLTMHGPCDKMSLCTLDFCGQEPAGRRPAHLIHFLRLFVGVERLHLTSARLGCGVGRAAELKFPTFPALRNLELTGMLPDDDTTVVATVTRILEQTPRLETLTLFFLPEPHTVVTASDSYLYKHADEETVHAAHKLRYDRHATLAVPRIGIPCLRKRTREINLVHYQGTMAQRMLAMFLLGDAPVVDEVFCEFARGPLQIQIKLMEEIKGWVLNKSAKMMFL